MAFTSIPRPSAPTYSEILKYGNVLLINATDYLMINSSNDKLLINTSGADDTYTSISRPSAPTYSTISKPS